MSEYTATDPFTLSPPSPTYTPPVAPAEPAAFRFLHYNDVYHINPATEHDPVGGAARFITLTKSFQQSQGSEVLTFFSGDCFNPSLESSITKGTHMLPVLNASRTNVACVGNHDLDFGVEQLQYLAKRCDFPWLCANVEDPALGEGVSLAGLAKTVMLEASGRKVGVIGVVEKEWLDTVNSLPTNLKFIEPSESVLQHVPALREQGAEMIVVVSHMREPNDLRLANELPSNYVDIILGGHDHFYAHHLTNNIHILRSGCDFKDLSWILASPNPAYVPSPSPTTPRYTFTITRHCITSSIPPDPTIQSQINHLSHKLNRTLSQPIGATQVPLNSLFTVVRTRESNLANFVCDLMRFYHHAPLSLMAGGTIRGDQIYPRGLIKLGDIINCFPFEDPVVVVRVKGAAFVAALENGVSKLPAMEGRFPHVSGCRFTYDSSAAAGSRIQSVTMEDGTLIDPDREYEVVTRGYMVKGKDGFTSLMPENGATEIVDEENGVLISMILRQYFLSLKIINRWRRGRCFRSMFRGLKRNQSYRGELVRPESPDEDSSGESSGSDDSALGGSDVSEDGEEDDGRDEEAEEKCAEVPGEYTEIGGIVRRLAGRWRRRVLGAKEGEDEQGEEGEDGKVDWTSAIAPRVEGRVVDIAGEGGLGALGEGGAEGVSA